MSLYELYRHDIQVYEDYSASDTRQIPAASVTCRVYKEGAYTNGTGSFLDGAGGTITVHDPGGIVGDTTVNSVVQEGDTICIGTAITGVTRQVASVTATTIVCDAGTGVFTWTDGARIVPLTNRPTVYTDDQAAEAHASSPNPATDSTGIVSFYTKEPVVDIILDDGTTLGLLADRVGVGGRVSYTPFTFGAAVDASTSDSAPMNRLEDYIASKGAGIVELPPGTIVLGDTWTIAASNVTIRGAGRGVTTIKVTHTGAGIVISGTDVTFEGVTMTRTAAGGTAAPQIKVTGTRVALRDIHFKLDDAGATTVCGISCLGDTDTRASNLWFTNTAGTWVSFIYTAGVSGGTTTCLRPHFTSVIARYVGAITAGIDVDGGTTSARFDKLDISPTDVAAAGGIAFRVRESLGLANPTDIIVSNSRLVGGSTANTASAVQLSTSTADQQLSGAEFIGVHCLDSNVGYEINNVKAVKIIGGSTVGINTHGIDINTGASHIQIVEHLSSDVNLSGVAGDYDHVNIAAGVDDIFINGLVCGKLIRGTGNDSGYGVKIASGVSDRIQIMGLRGTIADLTGWISNASTSREIDISHNIEYGNNRTYTHTAVPGGESVGEYAGTTIVISAADTTPSVLNVSVLLADLDGASTWTALDNGRNGQVVVVLDIDAANHITMADAGNFALNGAYTSVQNGTITLVYSSTTAKWHEISRTAP